MQPPLARNRALTEGNLKKYIIFPSAPGKGQCVLPSWTLPCVELTVLPFVVPVHYWRCRNAGHGSENNSWFWVPALWTRVCWGSQAYITLGHEQVWTRQLSVVVTGLRSIRLVWWPCAWEAVGEGKVVFLLWEGVGNNVRLCWREACVKNRWWEKTEEDGSGLGGNL